MTIIEKLRQYRIYKFAIFDFAASYIGMWLIYRQVKIINRNFTLRQMMFSVIPVSVIVHILVGQMTPLTKMIISPKTSEDYIAVIIFFICILGVLNVF